MNRHSVLAVLVVAVLMLTLAGPVPAAPPVGQAKSAAADIAAQAAVAAAEERARAGEIDILVPHPPPEPGMPDVVLTRAEVEAGTAEGVVEGQMRLAITSRTDETRCVLTLPPP
ncbi:MAG: hypothetical protein WBE00_00550, partial [Phycisphaerae bacterium]